MPERSAGQSARTTGSTNPQRLRDNASRRIALLEASFTRWMQEAGWPQSTASAQARDLMPMLQLWLDETTAERWFERLPSMAQRICERLPQPCQLTAGAFRSAFAHCMIDSAIADVAREASRAGHAGVFAGLRPYLLREPTAAELVELGATLDLSRAALAIALSRLRHRFRERSDTALGLWAADPETRNTLRRQLRESLLHPESIP